MKYVELLNFLIPEFPKKHQEVKNTQEVKLYILARNRILYKMKKAASPSCPFCPSDSQNIRHLFISCPQASSFWYKFQSWYSTVSKASLLLTEPEVLVGITRPCAHRLTLNHLIILGKFLLYINALNNIRFVFSNFISFMQDKIEIEKSIARKIYCCHVDCRTFGSLVGGILENS